MSPESLEFFFSKNTISRKESVGIRGILISMVEKCPVGGGGGGVGREVAYRPRSRPRRRWARGTRGSASRRSPEMVDDRGSAGRATSRREMFAGNRRLVRRSRKSVIRRGSESFAKSETTPEKYFESKEAAPRLESTRRMGRRAARRRAVRSLRVGPSKERGAPHHASAKPNLL